MHSEDNRLPFKCCLLSRDFVCVRPLRISRRSVFLGSLALFKYSWGGGDHRLKFQTRREGRLAGHPPDRAPGCVSAASRPSAGFVNTGVLTLGRQRPPWAGQHEASLPTPQPRGARGGLREGPQTHGDPIAVTKRSLPTAPSRRTPPAGLPQRRSWCRVRDGDSLRPGVGTPQLRAL